ncbi:hypothetical protein [Nostoc sp. 'Peltigera malacea cyanobiont' DB3992]|uniref:hypothetical protein n=1 Tax=Nostoc sp. 'Peltigera malacea cyanobiont' DB3992 TaxID=1206980 RepID=UPI00211EF928|nr:hypothetical protein [Nostoc sp. 'Peltigera malacea cyanobiont' DB3992]
MLNHKKASPTKKEPLQLLRYNQSVPTRVGIISLVGFSMAGFSLLLQILNYGAVSLLNNKQLTLIQLSSGDTISAKAVDPGQRSDEVIRKFISDTFIKMFNWDGIVQAFNEKGEPITKQDTGVEVGKINNKSNSRVTSKAYDAAFALSENGGFRAAFLKKLASITPTSIFNGDTQVSLIPRFISQPRQLREGKWEIDFIGTLVTFEGKGITFNKTITLSSISNPEYIPANTSELAKKIYATRRAGLEIIEIVDLDLGKRKMSEENNKKWVCIDFRGFAESR